MQPPLTVISGHAGAEVAPDDSAADNTTTKQFAFATTTMEVNDHVVSPDTSDDSLPPIRDLELGLEMEPDCEDNSIDGDHFVGADRPSSPNSVTSTDDFSFSSASWPGYKRERDCPYGDSPRRSSTTHASKDGKSVSFSELPVSHTWTRPKTEEKDKSDLYYSPEELQAFREEYRNTLRAARDAKHRAMMASTTFGKLSTLLERASSLIHQVIVTGGECKDGEQHQHLLVDTLYLF